MPTDPEALRAFAAGLQAELARKDIEIAANAAEIHAKTLHIEKLKVQLTVLRRARFGRSSEKLDRDIEQLELLIGELEEEQAEGDARASAVDPAGPHRARTRERKQSVRRPLRLTCRAKRSPTSRLAPVPVAAARCSAGWARTSARCSSMCRPASR